MDLLYFIIILLVVLGLLGLLWFVYTYFCRCDQDSSQWTRESDVERNLRLEPEEDKICVNVVSKSAERKHLYPDCQDGSEAEKISNEVRRHEQETFKSRTTYSQTQLVKRQFWYVLFDEMRH